MGPWTMCDEIDKHVTTMVNHVFDNGMREDEYKEILEDDIVKRPQAAGVIAESRCKKG